MLRLDADSPLALSLFTKNELAGVRKLQRRKKGRYAGALTAVQVIELGLEKRGLDVGMCREFQFHVERRWRFDFAWPAEKLAVEFEGIVMRKDSSGNWQAGGRHANIKGMKADMEKYNAATMLGWRVLRYEKNSAANGALFEDVAKMLGRPVNGDF